MVGIWIWNNHPGLKPTPPKEGNDHPACAKIGVTTPLYVKRGIFLQEWGIILTKTK
jgi:hypothetical protein